MRRVHLFELEDLSWFPTAIRDAGTDILRLKWEVGNTFKPIVPKLRDALLKTDSKRIIDLGSGGGGPVLAIHEKLSGLGCAVRVTLTDKFPNLGAFRYAKARSGGNIDFIEDPVDATSVPPDLDGFRTMFATLHHFRPEQVKNILQDSVDKQRPIGMFDFSARTPPPLSMMLLSNPFTELFTIPFVKPFRWSRLFWTYVIPLVPFFVAWDAFASGLRLYSVKELQEIVNTLPPNDYVWDIGKEPFPRSITYLIGHARST